MAIYFVKKNHYILSKALKCESVLKNDGTILRDLLFVFKFRLPDFWDDLLMHFDGIHQALKWHD